MSEHHSSNETGFVVRQEQRTNHHDQTSSFLTTCWKNEPYSCEKQIRFDLVSSWNPTIQSGWQSCTYMNPWLRYSNHVQIIRLQTWKWSYFPFCLTIHIEPIVKENSTSLDPCNQQLRAHQFALLSSILCFRTSVSYDKTWSPSLLQSLIEFALTSL